MTPRHIVMVISRFPPVIGGTEIQCRELSRALVKRGHRVTVLTERHEAQLPSQENLEGVNVIRLTSWGWPPVSSILFSIPLWHWLRANPDFDILHAHMVAAPAIAALLFGRWLDKPVIVKLAGAGATGDIGTSQETLFGWLKLALFKRLARFVTCPSSITYHEAESLGLAPSTLRLIPNGVDVERFQPLADEQKTKWQASFRIGEKRRVAVYAGRWVPGKGLEPLLAVWESAKDLPNFNWKLCLIVQPPPSLEQRMQLRKLEDRVEVLSSVRDLLPHYQAADLAILLSENEGLSNFLLEAMACGLPFVSTPSASIGSPETAETSGWLVSPSDTAGIAALLQSLQEDSPQLRRKGAVARQRAVESFSTQSVAEQYESLYEDALNVRDLRRR